MDIYNLCLVFGVIIILISFKKTLSTAILGGLVTAIVAYKIPILDSVQILSKAAIGKDTISIILSFYFITILQHMLEKRFRLKHAHEALNSIFNNRRINVSIAPSIIGLLPSAGALTICGSMVSDSCDNYLDAEEKTIVTSFFRHIPESFLPTYSSILIAITLSGVNMGGFVIAMTPMVLVLFALGYVFLLKDLPKDTGYPESKDKKSAFIKLVKSLWTIVLTVVIILAFNLPVYLVTPFVIFLNFFADKFTIKEFSPMFLTAIEKVIIFNTILIMMFKDIITYTGVINLLPDFFGQLPISLSLVFALIFFFGTIISGSKAIIALCMPMAMSTVPDAGLPLVVLLMCFSYAAMQVSPTHVCLFIATEYFGTSMGSLVRRTIPIILCFCGIVLAYVELLKILI